MNIFFYHNQYGETVALGTEETAYAKNLIYSKRWTIPLLNSDNTKIEPITINNRHINKLAKMLFDNSTDIGKKNRYLFTNSIWAKLVK